MIGTEFVRVDKQSANEYFHKNLTDIIKKLVKPRLFTYLKTQIDSNKKGYARFNCGVCSRNKGVEKKGKDSGIFYVSLKVIGEGKRGETVYEKEDEEVYNLMMRFRRSTKFHFDHPPA